MDYNHLVIVPCHGIWEYGAEVHDHQNAGDNRSEWLLASFQIEGNDHLCFKDHLLKGYEIISNDPQALMVISGGRTKQESKISEACSYFNLLKFLKEKAEFDNILLEEFARDSFENVIFLLCRFYEKFNKYPQRITIVGFEFKRYRFLHNHLEQALMFPIDNVSYIGNEPNPPDNREAYFSDLKDCEYKYAVRLFETDFYGVQNPLLKKKLTRNPYNTRHSYDSTNPLLKSILLAIDDNTSLKNDEILDIVSHTAPWL